jgi:radical SAM-linked protein
MVRQRYRIRFRKEGDLRHISHRDLVRTLERLFRRAGLPLGMSEGFHPKPRMSFPSALAVGVVGLDEVLELELTETPAPAELLAAISRQAPLGLVFSTAEAVADGTRKAQVRLVRYEATVPEERRPATEAAIARLLAETTHTVAREEGRSPVDLRPLVDELALVDGVLNLAILVTPEGSARPREVLAALGLADLEQLGRVVVRTRVELGNPDGPEAPVRSSDLPTQKARP